MGFWDPDTLSVVSRRSHDGRTKYSIEKRKSRSRSRSRSPKRGSSSIFGGSHGKHGSSRASFFGLPTGSRSSFFGLGRSSSSYYKRSPRKNFVTRAYKKLKHLLKDLTRHARRNPFKVFMLVLVPLVACGALTALLARFGLKLPSYVEKLIATAGKFATGDSVGLVGEAVKMAGSFTGSGSGSGSSIGRGGDGELRWERRREREETSFW